MMPDEEEKQAALQTQREALRPVRFRPSTVRWGLAGILLSGGGLLLLTMLARSPWLFLLYPILIGTLLLSLGVLALALLYRI